LGQLLGIPDVEAEDYSLSGRMLIITKLKAARNREIERGQSGSWLYDISRHLSLCAALRMECETFAGFLSELKQAELAGRRGDSPAPVDSEPAPQYIKKS
jgi:hypothetical protein